MRIDFVTLFPEMIHQALSHSMIDRASKAGLAEFHTSNPRDFTADAHRTVDDRSSGGGPGMVMMIQPIYDALRSIGAEPESRDNTTAVVLSDPSGKLFRQKDAHELTRFKQVIFICGHYEGIDERVRTQLCTHSYTIGDYVLTGGELPALVMTDSVVRLLPGVLGDPQSHEDDSHEGGLLGHPLFTKPDIFGDDEIPDVLKSGNHSRIADWRRQQSLIRTRCLRPDLFATADLTSDDLNLL